MDYAGAVSVERGRCFRFIYDEHGKPENCPEPLTATGWLKVDRWYEVDACAEHSAQLQEALVVPAPRAQKEPDG